MRGYEMKNLEINEQDLKEHRFVELYLNDREIESIALACNKSYYVFPTQFYFALAKKNGSTDKLELLSGIVQGMLKIIGVKLGVPQYRFYS